MNAATPFNRRVTASRVFSSLAGFPICDGFGLPLSTKIYRRPRHAGVVDIKPVPASKLIGSAGITMESTPFDLLSGFRPRRFHFACASRRELSDAHAHPGSN